jgi:hypothetical protein
MSEHSSRHRRSVSRYVMALGVAGGVLGGALTGSAQTIEPDDFVVDDAAELAELCAAATDDPYYVQAIHMCHGFVSGVAQYALLLFEAAGGGVVCLPDPPPSRSEAIADFVTWMDGQPELAEVEAPEAFVRFLQDRFPCR